MAVLPVAGSSLFDVKALGCDGSSGGFGGSVAIVRENRVELERNLS